MATEITYKNLTRVHNNLNRQIREVIGAGTLEKSTVRTQSFAAKNDAPLFSIKIKMLGRDVRFESNDRKDLLHRIEVFVMNWTEPLG